VGGQPKPTADLGALPGMNQHHRVTARTGVRFAPPIGVNLNGWHRRRLRVSVRAHSSDIQLVRIQPFSSSLTFNLPICQVSAWSFGRHGSLHQACLAPRLYGSLAPSGCSPLILLATPPLTALASPGSDGALEGTPGV